MSSKYIVSTLIQSPDIDNNEPVHVKWYSGDSLAHAIAAMASAAVHNEDDSDVPESIRPRTLGVTLSIAPEN